MFRERKFQVSKSLRLAVLSLAVLSSASTLQAVEPPPAELGTMDFSWLKKRPKVACDFFIKQTGRMRSWLRKGHYDVPHTEKVVKTIAGVPGRATLDITKALDEGEGWVKLYKAYLDDQKKLNGALTRFRGNPAAKENLQQRGRIAIFKEVLEKPEADVKFPMTIKFPRASHRKPKTKEIVLQRGGDLVVEWTFKDRKELERFLKEDEEEALILEELLVIRELAQAELFSKLRRLRATFPAGSFRALEARVEEMKRASLKVETSGEAPIAEPKSDKAPVASESIQPTNAAGSEVVDPFKDDDYRTVRLFREASRILHSKEKEFVDLKPSERALAHIDRITKTDKLNNFVTSRSTWDRFKNYFSFIPAPFIAINDFIKPAHAPIVMWGSLMTLLTTWGGWMVWTNDHVIQPTISYVVYDQDEREAKELYDKLAKAREEISVPARTIEDFYLGLDRRSGFYKYAQDAWSDEAVKIAFEYLERIRLAPEASAALDPKLDPKRLAGYTKEAKEIIKHRDALLFGYQSPYGSFRGVAERLEGRQYNYFLVNRIIERESRAAETNKEDLKNSHGTSEPVQQDDIRKPVDMGPPVQDPSPSTTSSPDPKGP